MILSLIHVFFECKILRYNILSAFNCVIFIFLSLGYILDSTYMSFLKELRYSQQLAPEGKTYIKFISLLQFLEIFYIKKITDTYRTIVFDLWMTMQFL